MLKSFSIIFKYPHFFGYHYFLLLLIFGERLGVFIFLTVTFVCIDDTTIYTIYVLYIYTMCVCVCVCVCFDPQKDNE